MAHQSPMQIDIFAEIQERIQANNAPYDRCVESFVATITKKLGLSSRNRVLDALEYALDIDYHHPGMDAKTYIKHPLRVATSVMLNANRLEPDIIITALIHNVLEVTRSSYEELHSRFGHNIATSVKNLTVDRSKDNISYKSLYYETLSSSWQGARIVKILDKYDNIYMIGFNPNPCVRSSYLDEIEEWIIPMARRDTPDIADDFARIVVFMRKNGYLNKNQLMSVPTGELK